MKNKDFVNVSVRFIILKIINYWEGK
jgi:hypothetical protein